MEEEPTVRYRSHVQLYGHFIWATKGRYPHLTPELERTAYRIIGSEAQKMNCLILALGGMPDHVHLVLRMPGTASPAQVMKNIKGISSTALRGLHIEFDQPFDWQDGYAFFSLGQSETERRAVIEYVQNQKAHHASGNLWADWEETRERAD